MPDRTVYSPGTCTKCAYIEHGTTPALGYVGFDKALGLDIFECVNPDCKARYHVKGSMVIRDADTARA